MVFETARTSSREVNYLTKIAPETLVHAFGWSGNGVLVVGYEQPDASSERDLLSRRSPRRSRVRRREPCARAPGERARVPDGRAARGHVAPARGRYELAARGPPRAARRRDPLAARRPGPRADQLVAVERGRRERAARARARRICEGGGARDAGRERVVRRSPGPRARGQRPQRGRHQRDRGRAGRRPRAVHGAHRRRHLPGDRLRVRGLRRRSGDRLPDGDRCERAQGALRLRSRRSGSGARSTRTIEFDVGALVHSPVDGALWAVEVDGGEARAPLLRHARRSASRPRSTRRSRAPRTAS